MVAESEVPLGTAEPVLFPGVSVVPKGTQCLDHPIFPALKRWAIFSEHKDAKYDPITPRVFKLSQYHLQAKVASQRAWVIQFILMRATLRFMVCLLLSCAMGFA